MPPGLVGNAVATFADGTLLATVLTRPGTSIADFVQGRITGGVWPGRPARRQFELVEGTELPGNNGLETSPDERHFYVVAFGWHSVADLRPARHLGGLSEEFLRPASCPTTSTGPPAGWSPPACVSMSRPAAGCARWLPALPTRCSATAAMSSAPSTLRPERCGSSPSGEPELAFNGVSAAAIVGDTLWLGSYQADRLAYRPLGR